MKKCTNTYGKLSACMGCDRHIFHHFLSTAIQEEDNKGFVQLDHLIKKQKERQIKNESWEAGVNGYDLNAYLCYI